MIVSAISANCFPSSYYVYPVKAKGKDNVSDTTFNALTQFSKKDDSNQDLGTVYQAMNLWREFCHEQIAQGKLDVIV